METLKLKHPININGKNVTELAFDFDALTGRDFALAAARAGTTGGDVRFMELDYGCQLYIAFYAAVRASNGLYSIEDMERIKGSDVKAVLNLGRAFLMPLEDISGSETSEDSTDNSAEPTLPAI